MSRILAQPNLINISVIQVSLIFSHTIRFTRDEIAYLKLYSENCWKRIPCPQNCLRASPGDRVCSLRKLIVSTFQLVYSFNDSSGAQWKPPALNMWATEPFPWGSGLWYVPCRGLVAYLPPCVCSWAWRRRVRGGRRWRSTSLISPAMAPRLALSSAVGVQPLPVLKGTLYTESTEKSLL